MTFGRMAVDWQERINYDRLRRERLERAKSQLEKDGLGSILCFDYCNVRYITGFYTPGCFRLSSQRYVLLPRNGDPVLWIEGAISTQVRDAWTPWLKGNVRASTGSHFAYLEPGVRADVMVNEIGKILAQHGLEKEPIGVDQASGVPYFWLIENFGKAGLKLVDGHPAMMEARKIKTRDEIECIRQACANAEAAMADVRDAIRPGVTEMELCGVVAKKLYSLGCDEYEDLVVCSGEHTNPNTHQMSDRQIRPGELVFVDIAGQAFNGYKTCVYRTFSVGKASSRQKELYQECYEMLYKGISKAKAGATTLDITKSWPTDPAYWGHEFRRDIADLAMGHGVGLSLYDKPIIMHALSRNNPIPLKENMVLALETWTGKKGEREGVRLEEMVLVTKDGYELLTRFPVGELIEAWL
ncbi:MAG: aminopeptidase P family protein [Chloroflexi bacterium]|nr:aminopeptidase P family protein [Chloroflexota bacterium]